MNAKKATELARKALSTVTETVEEEIDGMDHIVSGPVYVADATVLFKNANGTWSVCDNGEEVILHTEEQVIQIIIENLHD